MPNNLLDNTSSLQVGQRSASKRSVNFQSVNENSDGNETVGLDVLVELVRGGLVEDDCVLGLVLDYIPMNPASVFISVLRSSLGSDGEGIDGR